MRTQQWEELQGNISRWASKNFGENPPWQPMLGIMEEIGEFFAATNPEAASDPQSRENIMDSLGDQAIYALNLADKVGISFASEVDVPILNPPQDLAERELMGALAVGCRAILKNSQGIRGYTWDKRKHYVKVMLGLWYRWASYQAQSRGYPDMLDIAAQVFGQVSLRDWVKNPDDAHQVAKGGIGF